MVRGDAVAAHRVPPLTATAPLTVVRPHRNFAHWHRHQIKVDRHGVVVRPAFAAPQHLGNGAVAVERGELGGRLPAEEAILTRPHRHNLRSGARRLKERSNNVQVASRSCNVQRLVCTWTVGGQPPLTRPPSPSPPPPTHRRLFARVVRKSLFRVCVQHHNGREAPSAECAPSASLR